MTRVTLTADALLDGPRGRRLVVDWLRVRALDDGPDGPWQAFTTALFWAAYGEDRHSRSSSVALLGMNASEAPVVTARGVAAALAACPDAPPPSMAGLRAALASTVGAAAYWQPPHGDDVVAADPLVRGELRRFADAVVAAPSAQWWSDDLDRAGQHFVAWEDGPQWGRPTVLHGNTSAQLLKKWRADTIEGDERAGRERPTDPHAPYSGNWWSTPPPELLRSGRRAPDGSVAVLDFVEDGLGWSRAAVTPVSVASVARVVEIRSPADWVTLCRKYPLEVSHEKRHDWFHTTGRVGRWVIPDWAAVAEEADGVHLTVAAYLRGAGTVIPVDGEEIATVIAGWNPDETYWLNSDAVRSDRDGQGEIAAGERWIRGESDGEWRREAT